jgi:regulator of protease activity HflC (stomatin/prohibitin superfamily)
MPPSNRSRKSNSQSSSDAPTVAGCFGCLSLIVAAVIAAYLFVPDSRGPIKAAMANAADALPDVRVPPWAWAIPPIALVVYVKLSITVARTKAIRNRRKSVDLFFGICRMVLWEQNEAILILQNKKIKHALYGTDPRVGGGVILIWPIFGQELRVRVPLSLQLTEFKDENVMTRESMPVRIRVAFWWRLKDVVKYSYLIGEKVTARGELGRTIAEDQDGDKPAAAERWIQTLVESSLRLLVSQARAASLISTTPISYLDAGARPPALPRSTAVAAEVGDEGDFHRQMAAQLLNITRPKLESYGLEIERIEIQEVAFLRDIQDALNKVWVAMVRPAQSAYETRAREIELQGAASVLGIEAVSLIEILKHNSPSLIGGGTFADVISAVDHLKKTRPVAELPAVPLGDDGVIEGVVTGVKDYGAFLRLPDGRSGLCHIGELDTKFVNDIHTFVKVGDRMKVKVIGKNPEGKWKFSRRAAL